jgi:hypothetical protein
MAYVAGHLSVAALEERYEACEEHFGLVRLSRLGHDVPWTRA